MCEKAEGDIKPQALTHPHPDDENVPDPDEDFPDDDDLDDLDDELNNFIDPQIQSSKPHLKQPASTISPAIPSSIPAKPVVGPSRPLEISSKAATVTDVNDEGESGTSVPPSDEDLAKDFIAEMEKLMSGLEDMPTSQSKLDEVFTALRKAAEEDLKAGEQSDASPVPKNSTTVPAPSQSFKDTIAGLSAQLKNSDKATTENIQSGLGGNDEDAVLSQLLQGLGSLSGEGGSEDDITNMLLGMMDQMTTKEVLYDPMKELADAFPAWLEANKSTTSEVDMKKYKEQLKLVTEIVAKFEAPGYKDEDPDSRKYIVDRMQAMQSTGSIPPSLLGDNAFAQEVLAGDAGCNPQ